MEKVHYFTSLLFLIIRCDIFTYKLLVGSVTYGIRVILLSHGLKYNTKKYQYMVFASRGKYPSYVPKIKLFGSELSRVTKFGYLGHRVNTELRDDCHIQKERRALAV